MLELVLLNRVPGSLPQLLRFKGRYFVPVPGTFPSRKRRSWDGSFTWEWLPANDDVYWYISVNPRIDQLSSDINQRHLRL
jgi:hypothetical protein